MKVYIVQMLLFSQHFGVQSMLSGLRYWLSLRLSHPSSYQGLCFVLLVEHVEISERMRAVKGRLFREITHNFWVALVTAAIHGAHQVMENLCRDVQIGEGHTITASGDNSVFNAL